MAKRFGDQDFLDEWGEAWSCGDVEVLLPFYASESRYTDVGNNLTVHGHAALQDGAARYARWDWSGTAAGSLKAGDHLYPATGSRFSVPGVAFCTLADDGTIASHEDYYDLRAVLLQLDLLTTPA